MKYTGTYIFLYFLLFEMNKIFIHIKKRLFLFNHCPDVKVKHFYLNLHLYIMNFPQHRFGTELKSTKYFFHPEFLLRSLSYLLLQSGRKFNYLNEITIFRNKRERNTVQRNWSIIRANGGQRESYKRSKKILIKKFTKYGHVRLPSGVKLCS